MTAVTRTNGIMLHHIGFPSPLSATVSSVINTAWGGATSVTTQQQSGAQ